MRWVGRREKGSFSCGAVIRCIEGYLWVYGISVHRATRVTCCESVIQRVKEDAKKEK